MNNIWVGTDWHLWSENSINDKRHEFKSISRLGKLSDRYAEDIQQDDIFIHLGDLCDPSVTDMKKLQAIVSSIPGYKVLCKGNHDNQDDTFYKEIGFDEVCEICVIYNLVFSHKPVRVPPDYINIHGHLHTEKMSTLGYQHINAYDGNFNDHPTLVDDLIERAPYQAPAEYAGTNLKHVEEKFEKYTSMENDNYTQIIDLTDMVGIYPVDEAVELPEFKTPEDLSKWMKSNIHYSNFTKLKSPDGVVDSKSGSCHDQVVFEYNALKAMGKKPKILFFIAYKEGSDQGGMTHSLVYYNEGNKIKWFENSWSGNEGIHTYDSLSDLKADIKKMYSNMPDAKNFPELEFKSASISDFDTGMSLGEFVSGIMEEAAISWKNDKGEDVPKVCPKCGSKVGVFLKGEPVYLCTNKKCEKYFGTVPFPENEAATDPLDEVLFSDISDVQYWENDDDAPKRKKVKQSPLDTDDQGVVAESANNKLVKLFFVSSEDDLHTKEVTPRIPKNYMTDNGYEDDKTPRISFSTSIDGCLMGLGKNISNQIFYVYQPSGEYKIITPTVEQVPDVKITKERWICEPVQLIRVGKIRAIDENGPHDDGIPYIYGKNGEHEARLYHWGWKWIKKFKNDLNESASTNPPKVYFTREITPESLINIYNAIQQDTNCFGPGDTMVKISTGEPGKGPRYCLSPDLIGPLVQRIKGVICETNTADEKSGRHTTENHWKVIKKHGYNQIAQCDILDADADITIPVKNGYYLKELLAGNHITNYTNFLILSHFKGHPMAGFGGAMKNVAIGLSSATGKKLVHSGGTTTAYIAGYDGEKDNPDVQDRFLKSMVDANIGFQTIMPHAIYINIANNISVDCDCVAEPEAPTMDDIGIFASLDPLAVDQACIDAVYHAPHNEHVVERIESRHGLDILEYAEEKGVGSRAYQIIDLDQNQSITESTRMNTFPFIYLSQENMDDELYPVGKMLLRNMDDAVRELRSYQQPAGEYYVHNTEPGYYRIVASPEFFGGYFSTDNINLKMIGKIKVHDDYSWEWIEQFDTVNEAATFSQVKAIVNNIPKEEHHWFYHGKEFKDSPYVKYRDVMYLKNGRGKSIGGFIDVYAFDSDPDTGIIVIALEPAARGTGIATKLVQKALKKLPSLGIKKVIWHADTDNIASQKLAQKLGFTDISDLKANPDQYKYKYILNEMYLNSLSAAVEDTTELHEMSPKDKHAIANKYGLRTPGEYQQDGQDKAKERVNQRREKQLRDLKKARKIKKRKAFVRKVKSHLPGAQNETAGSSMFNAPKVVTSAPFNVDNRVDEYLEKANKKISKYDMAVRNHIPVPKRKFKKNTNKNRAVSDYYLRQWFGSSQYTIWFYPDDYCTLMFACANDMCEVYLLDSYPSGDYHEKLGSFSIGMGLGARLKAALKEDSSEVDDSDSDHYDSEMTDRDPLWGDRNHFFRHPNEAAPDYDKSIQETYKFELVDKNLRFVDRLDEAATKNQKLYPVYVVLVHSGTGVSKAIKAISHSEYSHASICFDSSLDKMYSFARKDPRNPFIGGFRYESIGKGFYDQKEIPYAVYVVPCTESQIKKMKKRLNYFIQNQEKFTFDFTGLVTNYLGIVNNPAHRWFCSRFVADVLNAGAPKDKPYVEEPSLQDPDDFKNTDWAIYVTSGQNLMKYNRQYVDRKTKQILRKEELRRMSVNESAVFDLDGLNPFIETTLDYELAMMDEAVADEFIKYLKSFKVKFDKDGNVIISRREVDQLDKHFRQSLRMIKAYEKAGDLDSEKLELCKINYMIELINEYYLSPKAMKSNRVKADLRKEMLDLRSVMLNAFSQHLKYVKTMDPAFNFKSYYDTSIYGKNIEIPKPVLSAIGKAIVTKL